MPKRKTRSNTDMPEDNAVIVETPSINTFDIPYKDKPIKCEQKGTSTPLLIFTHGAGGGIESPAVQDFAQGFSEHGKITLFQGNMSMKSRLLMFSSVIEHEQTSEALGGRSMGSRAAVSARTDETKALILVSYPLIGGKNQDHRDQILLDVEESIDVLFIVGDNDSMCPLQELQAVRERMKARTWLIEVSGAGHGMEVKPRVGSNPIRLKTGSLAAEWLIARDPKKQYLCMGWTKELKHTGWCNTRTEIKQEDQ